MFKPYVPTKTLEELTAEGFIGLLDAKQVYPEEEVLCYYEESLEGDIMVKPLEFVTNLSGEEVQCIKLKYSSPDGTRYMLVRGDTLENNTVYIDISRLLNEAHKR